MCKNFFSANTTKNWDLDGGEFSSHTLGLGQVGVIYVGTTAKERLVSGGRERQRNWMGKELGCCSQGGFI